MITCKDTGLNECPFCGHLPRWCGTGKDAPHDCHQITCDGCGVQFDINSQAATKAETLEELKEVAKAAWNQRYANISPVGDMGYQ